MGVKIQKTKKGTVSIKKDKPTQIDVTTPSKPSNRKWLLFAICGVIIVALAIISFIICNKSDKDPIVDNLTVVQDTTALDNADLIQGVDSLGAMTNAKDSLISVDQKDSVEKVSDIDSSNKPTEIINTDASNSEKISSSEVTKYKCGNSYVVYYFRFDNSSCSEEFVELQSLLDYLLANTNLKVDIIAYTDNIGSSDYNLHLSKQRANSIKNYLVGKGVNSNRITAQGKGISTAYSDNSKNRRAEFILSE